MDCSSLGSCGLLLISIPFVETIQFLKIHFFVSSSRLLATSFVSASMLRRTASDMGGTRAKHQSDQKGLMCCWASQSGRIFDLQFGFGLFLKACCGMAIPQVRLNK